MRAGGNRSKKDFDDVALKILEAWNSIVNPGSKQHEKREDLELKRVFVMGAITTGVESGFVLPEVSLQYQVPRISLVLEYFWAGRELTMLNIGGTGRCVAKGEYASLRGPG